MNSREKERKKKQEYEHVQSSSLSSRYIHGQNERVITTESTGHKVAAAMVVASVRDFHKMRPLNVSNGRRKTETWIHDFVVAEHWILSHRTRTGPNKNNETRANHTHTRHEPVFSTDVQIIYCVVRHIVRLCFFLFSSKKKTVESFFSRFVCSLHSSVWLLRPEVAIKSSYGKNKIVCDHVIHPLADTANSDRKHFISFSFYFLFVWSNHSIVQSLIDSKKPNIFINWFDNSWLGTQPTTQSAISANEGVKNNRGFICHLHFKATALKRSSTT